MENSDTNTTPPLTELARLYPGMSTDDIMSRLRPAIDGFHRVFGVLPNAQPRLFSAPGRTELIGNHTDHQRGMVIAAAVGLDMIAAAAPTTENVIRVFADAYGMALIDLNRLSPQAGEAGTPASLVRGVAEYLMKQGYSAAGGFDAYISGLVPVGSGLSSSAAFEVLIASTMNGLYFNGEIPPEDLARAGQYAENTHFGKPCGLMDQMASAVGGIIMIDFEKIDAPIVEQLQLSFTDFGYALCIIDTGAKHDQLGDEYAAIPAEMTDIANYLDADMLRIIEPEQFYNVLPDMKKHVSDRALLRAMHFFDENARVKHAQDALERRDFERYLRLVRESGLSSWMLLQNIYPTGSIQDQSAALALAWCQRLLGLSGACRIHGGGFGGTIQAYVPVDAVQSFKTKMELLTGVGSCQFLHIRDAGAVEIIL